MQRVRAAYSGGGRYLLRAVVLFACSLVASLQLSECFVKLREPPISTRARVLLNASLVYPAVTLCRVPGYRREVLASYGLGEDMRLTSEWHDFPFSRVPLRRFWEEATFNQTEIIVLYGLNKKPSNVAVVNSTHLLSGRCFTLLPLAETSGVGVEVGYSVLLRHGSPASSGNSDSEELVDGWQVYVHDAREAWSERQAARQDSVFLEVGQQLHVKVAVQDFRHVQPCVSGSSRADNYSQVVCQDACRAANVTALVGCGAPFLLSNASHCSDYLALRALMLNYSQQVDDSSCGCPRPCHTSQFVALVANRKAFLATTPGHSLSQLYVYYGSRMVSLVQEREDYDWSVFLADLGGTLGFLLGLSVLGLISLVESAAAHIVNNNKQTTHGTTYSK